MLTIKHRGSFKNTEKFLTNAQRLNLKEILRKHAQDGVIALSQATPKDTGLAAASWDYIIKMDRRGATLSWVNNDIENGILVVLLVQYGHGTRGGTYIQGNDFINPTIRPIFDRIVIALGEEVSKL